MLSNPFGACQLRDPRSLFFVSKWEGRKISTHRSFSCADHETVCGSEPHSKSAPFYISNDRITTEQQRHTSADFARKAHNALRFLHLCYASLSSPVVKANITGKHFKHGWCHFSLVIALCDIFSSYTVVISQS